MTLTLTAKAILAIWLIFCGWFGATAWLKDFQRLPLWQKTLGCALFGAFGVAAGLVILAGGWVLDHVLSALFLGTKL